MKMLKPFFGPQDCGSTLATSPTAPTRRLPPTLGCAALAAAGAVVAAAVGAAEPALTAAGATCVGCAGTLGATPHAAANVAVVTVTSMLSASRRVKRFAAKGMWSSPWVP